MIKRMGLVLFSLSILTVFSSIVDCGCEYAHAIVTSPEAVESSSAGHCEHTSTSSSNQAHTDSCCTHCVLEEGTAETQGLTALMNASGSQMKRSFHSDYQSGKVSLKADLMRHIQTYESGGILRETFASPLYISLHAILI